MNPPTGDDGPQGLALWKIVLIEIGTLLLLGALALAYLRAADPYPHYVRPASLFFPEKKGPPVPPTIYQYVAAYDLPEGTDDAKAVSLDATTGGAKVKDHYVSKRIETFTTTKTETKGRKRKPVALEFVVDCSGTMSTSDGDGHRFDDPADLASSLGPDDLFAYGIFDGAPASGSAENPVSLPMGWTPATQVPGRKADLRSGSSMGNGDGAFLGLMDDSVLRGKERIAIVMGDLVDPDDAFALQAVKDFVAKGVKVYMIKFPPGVHVANDDAYREIEGLCARSGGKAVPTADFAAIRETLGDLGLSRTVVTVERHRLLVTFRSTNMYALGQEVGLRVDGRRIRAKIQSRDVVPR